MKHEECSPGWGGDRCSALNWGGKGVWRLGRSFRRHWPNLYPPSHQRVGPGETEMSPELRVQPRQAGAEQRESTRVQRPPGPSLHPCTPLPGVGISCAHTWWWL